MIVAVSIEKGVETFAVYNEAIDCRRYLSVLPFISRHNLKIRLYMDGAMWHWSRRSMAE